MNPGSHTRTVQARFSRAAPLYDSYAELQRAIATELVSLMPTVDDPTSILEIGCGTGQLTRLLRARWPQSRITALDLAETMIRHAQSAFSSDTNISWVHADIMDMKDTDRFAVIASNCALHWIEPFAAGIQHIASLLSPGGCLAAAIMEAGTLFELHEARRAIAPHKTPIGRLPSHEEICSALEAARLAVMHAHQETRTMISPSATELLHVLHRQGLTGGLVSRATRPLGRQELDRLIEYYDHHFPNAAGGVRAGYCVGYFIARKADQGTAPP